MPRRVLPGREAALKLAWPVLEIPPKKNQQSSVDEVRYTFAQYLA
ncbi:hypothetical protein ACF08M_00030 [Streptomyces sp. NPDC015032]